MSNNLPASSDGHVEGRSGKERKKEPSATALSWAQVNIGVALICAYGQGSVLALIFTTTMRAIGVGGRWDMPAYSLVLVYGSVLFWWWWRWPLRKEQVRKAKERKRQNPGVPFGSRDWSRMPITLVGLLYIPVNAGMTLAAVLLALAFLTIVYAPPVWVAYAAIWLILAFWAELFVLWLWWPRRRRMAARRRARRRKAYPRLQNIRRLAAEQAAAERAAAQHTHAQQHGHASTAPPAQPALPPQGPVQERPRFFGR